MSALRQEVKLIPGSGTEESEERQPFTTGMAAPAFTGKLVVRASAGEHELLAVAGV